MLWSKYFIESQGHSVGHSKIYQDNQSNMLLEKNGRMSWLKRTNHIKAIYFDKGPYWKTAPGSWIFSNRTNVTDILNNPKHGKVYCLFRIKLMNLPVEFKNAVDRSNENLKLLVERPLITPRPESSQELSKKWINKKGLTFITGVCCANSKLGNGGLEFLI